MSCDISVLQHNLLLINLILLNFINMFKKLLIFSNISKITLFNHQTQSLSKFLRMRLKLNGLNLIINLLAHILLYLPSMSIYKLFYLSILFNDCLTILFPVIYHIFKLQHHQYLFVYLSKLFSYCCCWN